MQQDLVLAIDVGNSRTKLGLFQGRDLIDSGTLPKGWSAKDLEVWLGNRHPIGVCTSSVAALPNLQAPQLKNAPQIMAISHEIQLPFVIGYETPESLGRDRIAAVAGAFASFPEHACLVVDAGTCVTYEVLTADGVYQGGNIAPGLSMRLQAMHAFTARLPEVSSGEPAHWWGTNTTAAMQNGALMGLVLEVEGYYQRCLAQWNQHFHIVLTGGDTSVLARHIKLPIFARPNLVLEGLNEILLYQTAQ